jgi:hypothetical protein
MIGSDKEVVYNEKYDAMVEVSSEESDKFYDIISNIIDDKLISGEQLFKIAIQYSKYVKMHPILNLALKSMKITNYHLDELTKEYNGSLDILKEFDKWLVLPNKKQYCKLVENNCIPDPDLMAKYNIPLDNDYVLASIKAGRYPILGIPIKDKILMNDLEKKQLKKNIFLHQFSKKDLNNMRKQFILTFDQECMADFCKNDGRIAIYKYLIDLNLKPTVDDLINLIPKHCSHSNVHTLLSLAKN